MSTDEHTPRINEMREDGEPETTAKPDSAEAETEPAPAPPSDKPTRILGALRGTVLKYDEPFQPAADPSDWEAAR